MGVTVTKQYKARTALRCTGGVLIYNRVETTGEPALCARPPRPPQHRPGQKAVKRRGNNRRGGDAEASGTRVKGRILKAPSPSGGFATIETSHKAAIHACSIEKTKRGWARHESNSELPRFVQVRMTSLS